MKNTLLFEAVGIGQKIQIFPEYLHIISDKNYNFTWANKTIFLRFISAIKLNRSGKVRPGIFSMEFSGGVEGLAYHVNENTISFSHDQESDFIKLKEILEERILTIHSAK